MKVEEAQQIEKNIMDLARQLNDAVRVARQKKLFVEMDIRQSPTTIGERSHDRVHVVVGVYPRDIE